MNTDNYATVTETVTFGSGAPFWVRGWFYLSALPAGGNGMELMRTTLAAVLNGDYVFSFAAQTTIYSQFANAMMATSPVPATTWFCLIFNVVPSSTTAGSLELSCDVPTTVLANTRTEAATMSLAELSIGMGFSSTNVVTSNPAIDLYLDDVIVHSAAVTCAD